MPRKEPPEVADHQASLFPEPTAPAGGHVHAAAQRSVARARESNMHEAVDELLGATIEASALALDRALHGRNAAYAVAQLLTPFRELLEAGSMTPAVRASAIDDELKEALDAIANPVAAPADGGAEAPHGPDAG